MSDKWAYNIVKIKDEGPFVLIPLKDYFETQKALTLAHPTLQQAIESLGETAEHLLNNHRQSLTEEDITKLTETIEFVEEHSE